MTPSSTDVPLFLGMVVVKGEACKATSGLLSYSGGSLLG